MSADASYLDSSALVKLVVPEPESAALAGFLGSRPLRVSCALARVEVIRAVRGHGASAAARARQVLQRVHLIRLDDTLLDVAAELQPSLLRSLDAIHLAAALALGTDLREVITYDERMAKAARQLGLRIVAPQ